MNLPANFEILDARKYLGLLMSNQINLVSHLNYYFGEGRYIDDLEKRVADMLGFNYQKTGGPIINRFATQKSLRNAQFIATYILCEGETEMLDELFGSGKRTTQIGEGRATIYFVKINGKIVTLLHDSRGVSINMEDNLSKDEFLDIEIDLIKYLWSGYKQEQKDEVLKICQDVKKK